MWMHLQSKDSGLFLSLFSILSLFWRQAATFLPIREPELSWPEEFEWKSFQRWKEGWRKRKMRWPLLSPALPLPCLKPASVGPRRSEWAFERERERDWGTLSLHLARWRGCEYFFYAVQMSLVWLLFCVSSPLYFPRSLNLGISYIISFPISFYPSS